MQQRLLNQRTAWLKELPVSLNVRLDRIERALDLVVTHQAKLCDALAADFGNRPTPLSRFADIMPSVKALKHARSHTRQWMRPERRKVDFPMNLLGAKAWIEYQPKGVVGLISPWNFPIMLTFCPLAGMLAAGNRVMIKPSEFTPETSKVTAELIAQAFDPDEIDVFTGGAKVGKEFSSLPFDHILFTGNTEVGKHVMRAAADNLTPVTLELGGKSPAIIGLDANLTKAADAIAMGKTINAGQACLAPDYLFVAEQDLDRLIDRLRSAVNEAYPSATAERDFACVLKAEQRERHDELLGEAKATDTRIEALGPDGTTPITLVVNPADDSGLMRGEIFGPILPIKTYGSLDEVIDYINARPRPLGLYYFGKDRSKAREVLERTVSGGVTLNDVMFHITADELPFGGVGASGMGHYHGEHGFKTFSHAKAVYQQSPLSVGRLVGALPPYGKRLEMTLKSEIRK